MAKQNQDDGALLLGLLGEQADADAVASPNAGAIDSESGGEQIAAADAGAAPEGNTSDGAGDPSSNHANADPSASSLLGDDESPDEEVLGLVLLDCLYGKCGEVKPFAAAQAHELRVAGYIDTHPNAVAWAKG